MPRDIPLDDLLEFLERPVTSVLATHERDGRVRLSPVWHEWRDGGFNVVAFAGSEKVRHIRRDQRVSFVVAEQAHPWTGVELHCDATILMERVESVARRINARYEGAERGEGSTQETAPISVVLRLQPGTLRTWNYADEEGE